MNTMDATTSDRSVRRPRIRTNSERDRRQRNYRVSYARNKNTFKPAKSRVWCKEHKLALAARDALNGNKI